MFKALKKLLWFFKKEKKRYLVAITLLIIASVLEIIPPRLFGFVIDDVHQGRMTSNLMWQYLGVYIALMIIIYLITFIWMRKLFGGSFLVERTLRSRLMNHLMKMTPTFFERNKTGELMAKGTNDLKAISQTVGFGILTLIDSTVFLIVILFMMTFFISWQLTLAAFLPLPIMAFIIQKYGKLIHERFMEAQESFGDLNDQVLESIAGVRVIRAFVKEDQDRNKFEQQTDVVLQKNINVAKIDSLFEPTIKVLVGISYMIGLGFGAYLVFRNQLTLGELVTFNIYLGMLIWPMFAIGELMNVMQRGSASLDRLNETLETEADVYEDSEPVHLLKPEVIRFNELSFKYPTAQEPSLEKIDVEIKNGWHVGIVGRTGSGKTTFFRQLLREYPVETGVLSINEVPIEKISLETLKSWIGYVPQESFLFSKTIEENIRFGAADASIERLEQVMEQSAITRDLDTFQDGLETLVGEKGVSLSGGQKQRIAIARALLKNPELLILDDAMSAVDAKTEQLIIESIRKERAGKTTLISAHRMSAVRHAELILVLDRGHIIERGTHEELMELGGWYSEQYTKQQMGKESGSELNLEEVSSWQ